VTKRFDAILFDAGGIFLIPDPVTLGAVVRPLGGDGSIESCIRAHYAGMAAIDAIVQRENGESVDAFSWDGYRRGYALSTGVAEKDIETAITKLRDVFSPFLWRFPLLESTAALWKMHLAGLPIGIVSNASGHVEATLANQCICQVGIGAGVPVEIVTDSHVIGVAKPHPGIFADALRLMNGKGFTNDRIAYIGDSYVNDIGGARNAGLVPILLDPYDDHAHETCERIRSLHELLAFI